LVRRFGDLEAAIMDVMWVADGPMPVREVVARLRESRELAYTTVQTVMDILFRKGWVDRELKRRAYVYWAKASREDYVAGLMVDALEVSPDRGAALARFVEKIDHAGLEELRALLDAARSEA
jgi:predicted transcriptional regulator